MPYIGCRIKDRSAKHALDAWGECRVLVGSGGKRGTRSQNLATNKRALEKLLLDYAWASSRRGLCCFDTRHIAEPLFVKWRSIVHLHNLHPDYFNLFALPSLAAAKPVVRTLHDKNSFTGHCGFTVGCDGWKAGCKPGPFPNRYLEMSEDNAAEQFDLKRRIYRPITGLTLR